MGLNTIPSALGNTIIPSEHHNGLRSALIGDLVPRAVSGSVADLAGSLGTSALTWTSAFVQSITLGATGTIELTEDGNNDLVISIGGAERAKIPALDSLLPPGMIVPYSGDTAPQEWILCEGAAVSRITYVRLFTAIGTRYGEGDGATSFNVPDFRGQFLRGADNGAGVDPDAASRAAMNTNGATGDAVGSVQNSQNELHAHSMDNNWNTNVGNSGGGTPMLVVGNGNGYEQGVGSSPPSGNNPGAIGSVKYGPGGVRPYAMEEVGGAEARPTNASVNYLIKT